MSGPAQTLRDLIDRALLKNDTTSINQLAKVGQKAGYAITQTTLSQIANGKYRSTPKRPTLEALAFLAGVPYAEAAKAAGLAAQGPPFHEELSDPAYDGLTREQREVVKAVARALLDAQKPSVDSGIERTSSNTDQVNDVSHGIAYITDSDFWNSNEVPRASESG